MEAEVIILTILFRNGGARYEIEDGIVTRLYGLKKNIAVDVPLPPREFYESWKERAVVDSINCSIFRKVLDETSSKGFKWEILERLDKEESDLVDSFIKLETQNRDWNVGEEVEDKVETMENGDVWVCLGRKRILWSSLKEKVEG